jgi:hypothetical protein
MEYSRTLGRFICIKCCALQVPGNRPEAQKRQKFTKQARGKAKRVQLFSENGIIS